MWPYSKLLQRDPKSALCFNFILHVAPWRGLVLDCVPWSLGGLSDPEPYTGDSCSLYTASLLAVAAQASVHSLLINMCRGTAGTAVLGSRCFHTDHHVAPCRQIPLRLHALMAFLWCSFTVLKSDAFSRLPTSVCCLPRIAKVKSASRSLFETLRLPALQPANVIWQE